MFSSVRADFVQQGAAERNKWTEQRDTDSKQTNMEHIYNTTVNRYCTHKIQTNVFPVKLKQTNYLLFTVSVKQIYLFTDIKMKTHCIKLLSTVTALCIKLNPVIEPWRRCDRVNVKFIRRGDTHRVQC